VALSFLIVSGMKEVAGKPRPDLLARCDPDLSRLPDASVGGIGQQIDEGIVLVSWSICRKTGSVVEEGFRSFPSGHAASLFSVSSSAATIVSRADICRFSILFRSDLPCSLDQREILDCNPHVGSLAKASESLVQSTRNALYPLSSGRSSHLPRRIPPLRCRACNICLFDSILRFLASRFDIIVGAILGIATAWLGCRGVLDSARRLRTRLLPDQHHGICTFTSLRDDQALGTVDATSCRCMGMST